jgi:hypothetical protein
VASPLLVQWPARLGLGFAVRLLGILLASELFLIGVVLGKLLAMPSGSRLGLPFFFAVPLGTFLFLASHLAVESLIVGAPALRKLVREVVVALPIIAGILATLLAMLIEWVVIVIDPISMDAHDSLSSLDCV